MLVREAPQDFVTFARFGAMFLCFMDSQFITRWLFGLPEAVIRELRADVFMLIIEDGVLLLLHFENQLKNDPAMGRRILYYVLEGERLFEIPAWGHVFWFETNGNLPTPPWVESMHDGVEKISFLYGSTALGNITVAELRQQYTVQGNVVPYLLICKDGARREVFDEAFNELVHLRRPIALGVLKSIALEVFKNAEDRLWIERRYDDMLEFDTGMEKLFENSPFVLELLAEGEAKGLIESIEQFVQLRYPTLIRLAHTQIQAINDLNILKQIQTALFVTNSAQQAQNYLQSLG
jgi:hypothetical protein